MTKAFVNLPARPKNYAPKFESRRFGIRNFITAAYKSDGDAAPEPDAAALLTQIQEKVKAELESRNFQNAEGVSNTVKEMLKDVNIEALRNFDAAKIKGTVDNLAQTVEKMQNNPMQRAAGEKLQAIRSLLKDENTLKLIERAFDRTSGTTVKLNSRAAVPVMTTGNVVNDGDIPEDILNSFSVDAFIKRRYPREFIFDIADRATVQEITEYKTWLEEGTEDGAFAIVAQGAVKPLVSKTLIRNTTKYRKVAGKRVYTEEFAKFRKEAYRIIEQLFNDQLMRNYAAILVTSLNTAAASYVGTTLDAQYPNPTDYHAIAAVAAQIETLEFVPDTLIINPQDKWRIGMEQNTQGSFFVNVPMYNPGGEVTMLGFTAITSNRVPAGQAYLGEGRLYKIEDEPVTVRLGYGINVTKDSNGFVTDVDSDVDTNRFRIIAETYFHNYIGTNNAGSFVKFSFNTVKTALLKP